MPIYCASPCPDVRNHTDAGFAIINHAMDGMIRSLLKNAKGNQ